MLFNDDPIPFLLPFLEEELALDQIVKTSF
jgi:hypothetical protein